MGGVCEVFWVVMVKLLLGLGFHGISFHGISLACNLKDFQ